MVNAWGTRAAICRWRRRVGDGEGGYVDWVYTIGRVELKEVAGGKLLLKKCEEIILSERRKRRGMLGNIPEVVKTAESIHVEGELNVFDENQVTQESRGRLGRSHTGSKTSLRAREAGGERGFYGVQGALLAVGDEDMESGRGGRGRKAEVSC